MASAVTRRQDTEAVLAVLYHAIRTYGVPKVLVSDSGSVFLSHDAMRVYDALGIKKEQIKKGRPYQNYIETFFQCATPSRRLAFRESAKLGGFAGCP